MKLELSMFCVLLTILGLSHKTSNAQALSIHGKVADRETRKPLAYAAVTLMYAKDSLIADEQLTDRSGLYEFRDITSGQYRIRIASLGYKTAYSDTLNVLRTSVMLPATLLTTDPTMLEAVRIVTHVPFVEYKADRIVVNIAQMNTAGDNALELLKRLPGVVVDKDGNIILKGKAGVNVMVNGQMSYMSGIALTSYLKSLPGVAIHKIELISNPPASFDAAGPGGYININLKRNKFSRGISGNANLGSGYGKYEKIYGGFNLNYNTTKISSYLNVDAGKYNSYNRITVNRIIDTEQYNQVNYWHPVTRSLNYTAGVDYFLSDRHTLGLMLKGYASPDQTEANSNSENYNRAGEKTGSVKMLNPQKNRSYNYAVNLNYNYKPDTSGMELRFNADYVQYQNGSNQHFSNYYYDQNNKPVHSAFLKSSGANDITIYALKLDYVYPLSKKAKLEAGWKSSWVKTYNDLHFDSLKANGWMEDPFRTNEFNFVENINAGYASYNQSFKNFDFTLGLRTEQTIDSGQSGQDTTTIKANYWKLFPNISISWRANKNNHLTVSYRKSITRPAYTSLNPFTYYSDPYTAMQGNPLLKPSFAHNYEFNYYFKNFRLLTVSFTTVNDVVSEMIYQNDITKQSVTRPENLNKETDLYFATGGPADITKWWNLNPELAVTYTRIESIVQNINYRAAQWHWVLSLQNTFTLPRGYVIDLSSYYSSAGVEGLTRFYANYQLNAGIKKTFWKRNASVALKVYDVLATSKYKSNLSYANINTYWQNEWESRRIFLTFSYQFGKTKIKRSRHKDTGIKMEESRVSPH